MEDDDLLWTLVASGAALGAARLAKEGMTKGWVRARGKVPGNPASKDTSWGEALAWAVVSGIGIGVVRLLAQRVVAAAFEKRRGSLPAKATTEATA